MGFGTIFGATFAFFTIIFVFFGSLMVFNDQVLEQKQIMLSDENLALKYKNFDFEISNPYISSGRIHLNIENGENQHLRLKNDLYCFDSVIDTTYITNSEKKFILENKPINSNYEILEENQQGEIILDYYWDETQKDIKITSCEGISKYLILENETKNWWNSTYQNRKTITINNNANQSLYEYQFQIELNNSNFDFSNIQEEDFRFVLPLEEHLVINLPFDNYKQTLDEYSNYNNEVFLGGSVAIAGTDPSSSEEAILFNSLNYDGDNDYNKISIDDSLKLMDEFTVSTWIKWDLDGNQDQNIITFGDDNNYLSLVNNGGGNHQRLQFRLILETGTRTLYSNQTISDTNWHFISAVFTGEQMQIYIDNELAGNLSVNDKFVPVSNDYHIGSRFGSNSRNFKGNLDEFKIFNIGLNKEELTQVYYNSFRFEELDFYIQKFDDNKENATIFVQVPFVKNLDDLDIQMYYNPKDVTNSYSNIQNTFSYDSPRTIGYLLSDRISTTTGLSYFSLYDNNTLEIEGTTYNIDEQQGGTIGTADLEINTSIKMTKLTQVEGNGARDDIIVPISWAGKEFHFQGFRAATENFCMLAPFNQTVVYLYQDGVLNNTLNIDSTGLCHQTTFGTTDVISFYSDIPVLISYYGSNNGDTFSLYKASSKPIFGIPSQRGYFAVGNASTRITILESDGSLSNQNLNAFEEGDVGGQPNDGQANAFKIMTNTSIGMIQQADSDGSESSVFVPAIEMGFKFGSNNPIEHIVLASEYANANCSTYDSTGTLIDNIPNGNGYLDIYKYGFDEGDTSYLAAGWKLECDKPVWGYFEEDSDSAETSMLGHMQMRQYIYPEPTITIN